MKRVVAFFDMFDEIPDNAKYLFSRKIEHSIVEANSPSTGKTAEKQAALPIPGGEETQVAADSAILFIHYYEVDDMDFEALMSSNFIKKQNVDKMKDLFQQYKIPSK